MTGVAAPEEVQYRCDHCHAPMGDLTLLEEKGGRRKCSQCGNWTEPQPASHTQGGAGTGTTPTPDDSDGNISMLGVFGLLFLLAGIGGAGFAMTYDTAPSGTHNLGLLQFQANTVVLSAAVFLGGIVLLAADAVRSRM